MRYIALLLLFACGPDDSLVKDGVYNVTITYTYDNWPSSLAGTERQATWIIGRHKDKYKLRVAGTDTVHHGNRAESSQGPYLRFRTISGTGCDDHPHSAEFHANVVPIGRQPAKRFEGDGFTAVIMCNQTDLLTTVTFESTRYEEF